MATKPDIVDAALKYLGTPFRHQGRTAEGLDCVGLVVRVAMDLDLYHEDVPAYNREANGVDFVAQFAKQMDRKTPVPSPGALPGCMEPGDVLLFRDRRFTIHAGILIATDRLQVLHAYAPLRSVVKSFPLEYSDSQGTLYDRVSHVFSYRGLEE